MNSANSGAAPRQGAAVDRARRHLPAVCSGGCVSGACSRGDNRWRRARRAHHHRQHVRPGQTERRDDGNSEMNWLRSRSYAWPVLGALLAFVIFNGFASPAFIDPANWNGLLVGAAPFIIAAMA